MSAKIVLDSISKAGKRIISVECTYWRAIHSEVMTHRSFARNAASSRAIPWSRTATRLRDNPYLPKYIGVEQKGMQSGTDLVGEELAKAHKIILEMKDFCLEQCNRLAEMGIHKSIINRYVEPWSTITTLITATEWKNFFRLRIHKAAEKHFNELAIEIRDAMAGSVPVEREWHIPYLTPEDSQLILADQLAVGTARCARLSYLTHAGVRDVREDLGLFGRLMPPDDIPHSSPAEHCANGMDDVDFCSGPYRGWLQYRKLIPNESVPG